MAKNPLSRWNSEEISEFSDDSVSFSDIEFGFLYEHGESSSDSSFDSGNYMEDEEAEDPCDVEENKKFWETQNQLLQATLYRTTSLETRIRQSTKEAVRVLSNVGVRCTCWKPVARGSDGGCRDCLRREISVQLQSEGYNCMICKSKWKSSHDILPGEHTYLEVVDKLSSNKGEIRVVIELNFRAEFEMARGSDEYNRLINRLPEIFVGKVERLNTLIKILCSAAKKCMNEKKMHLGPWRKHKYVQSKWLGNCERSTVWPTPLPAEFSSRLAKPRASMLTFDLLEGSHCTAVQVL